MAYLYSFIHFRHVLWCMIIRTSYSFLFQYSTTTLQGHPHPLILALHNKPLTSSFSGLFFCKDSHVDFGNNCMFRTSTYWYLLLILLFLLEKLVPVRLLKLLKRVLLPMNNWGFICCDRPKLKSTL